MSRGHRHAGRSNRQHGCLKCFPQQNELFFDILRNVQSRQVARRTLLHNGLSEAAINEKLGECMDAMVRYASAHTDIAKVGIEVLPGVAKLLEELSKRQDQVTVALVSLDFSTTCRPTCEGSLPPSLPPLPRYQ